MTRCLITGAAGFIAHHTFEHLLATTDWDLIGIDSLSYAGDPHRFENMKGFDADRVTIVWHDLNAPLVGHPTSDRIGPVDHVINMAAGSHVDRSIDEPVPFFTNNVAIALNVLEWVRLVCPDAKVVQVSTDEVYGPAATGQSHAEWDTILPSNPYAGSKAAQEAAAFAYWRTYGLRLAITNTMNNFGERQHTEKFVPMAIRDLVAGKPVTAHGRPVYLDGNRGSTQPLRWEPSSRVWLHARNHADAMRWLLDTQDFPTYGGEVTRPLRYNVAGEREIGVDGIVGMIADTLGVEPRIEWVDYHSSRPGHDLRYSLDGSKITAAGWVPPVGLDESFERTVKWYVDHPEWLYG